MSNQPKYCIFCFRKNTEVTFNREHIIPQSIGGNLFIDEVCESCNSSLGHLIDIQILKYPEILGAFEYLKIRHDKSGILKNYYRITAKSNDLEIPAIYQNEKYEILPKKMPDGSIIVPEETHGKTLDKMVKRDERIRSSGVSKEYVDDETNKVKQKYRIAKPGEFVPGPSIGRTLLKRREKFEIIIEPKGRCEIERFIAKIYYEFMYFVEGRFIFHNADDLMPILALIDKGETSKAFHFSRQVSKFENPIASHLIRFVFQRTHQQLYISFFGILDFLFMTFYHHENFWDKTEEHFGCRKIKGIHFEQTVKSGEKRFWFLDEEDKLITK